MKKSDQSDTTHNTISLSLSASSDYKGDVNDVHGNSISSGIYLLRIEAGDFKETRKISVIK